MATKLKYDARLLMESGELIDSLKRIGCTVESLGNNSFIRSKEGNLPLEIKRNKPFINGVELSQFLKSKGQLEKYLELNTHIFATDKDNAFDLILDFVEGSKEDILCAGENLYRYNGRFYELFAIKEIEDHVYKLLRASIIPTEKDVDNATYFVYKEFITSARKYNMRMDYSHEKCVKLAFVDGTLYVSPAETKFVREHKKEDNLFSAFNFEYEGMTASNGVMKEWFDIRFKSEADLMIAKTCIADLFVTSNYSQTMFYMYGAGGVGKSLLQDTISGMLNERATSTVNINDVGSQFKTAPLFKSIINFSSEISRKQINAEKFKSIIARDEDTLAMKFRDDCKGRPLAKWFSVANSLPTIEMDSGVKRRLLVIECTSHRVEEVDGMPVSKGEFEQMFKEDVAGFVELLIEGIQSLFNHKFDLATLYEAFIGDIHMKEVVTYNDPVAYFLDRCVVRTSEKRKGIYKDKLFEVYEEVFRPSTMGTGIQPMKYQTFASRVKELGVKDKQDKIKQADGSVKTTRRYYEGYSLTKDIIVEMSKRDMDFKCFSYKLEQGEFQD